MKIYVLASGSKGNMTCVKTKGSSFFIDAGISMTKIKQKMNDYNMDMSEIDTLFMTHEHSDHVAGLKALLKLGHIKTVYISKGTYEALSADIQDLMNDVRVIKADQQLEVNDLIVHTLMLSHDANEPIGFKFVDSESKSLVLLTDTGYVDNSYDTLLKGSDVYILEANHNPNTLIKSSRPFHLKQRILGVKGHLSNEDAVILMNRYVTKHAAWVVGHMSEDCNSILDVEKAIVDSFEDPTKITCLFASQVSLEVIEI